MTYDLKSQLDLLYVTGTKVEFPTSGNLQYRAEFPVHFPEHFISMQEYIGNFIFFQCTVMLLIDFQ